LAVDDLLNTFSSVIAVEGSSSRSIDDPGEDDDAKNMSLSSTTIGSGIYHAIDLASEHLNSFIGVVERDGGKDATLRKKYSNLCTVTCHSGEFSLALRVKGRSSTTHKRVRFGCDGRAAFSRAHDLGYLTRCREIETLVCSIGRRDEETIVCVLSRI